MPGARSPLAGLAAAGLALAVGRTATGGSPTPAEPVAAPAPPKRRARRALDAVLWAGSVLGVLAAVAWIGALVVLGRPVVITTGSMSPRIPVGALVFERTVPAADVRPGMVVTVPRPGGGGLVTHRVHDLRHRDGSVVLELQGDANPRPDDALVEVRTARTPVLVLPHAGRWAEALRSGPAGAALGAASAASLLIGLRPRRRRRGRRARLA